MAGQTQKCNYCDIVLCRGETCDRCRLTRRPCAETMAHHQSKIVGGDLDRVTFLHIGDTPQPRPAQGADLENTSGARRRPREYVRRKAPTSRMWAKLPRPSRRAA